MKRSAIFRPAAVVLACAAALAPAPLWAHAGRVPAPHDLWRAWTLAPGVLIPLYLTAWIYSRGVEAVWRRAGRGRGVTRAQVAAFAGGMAALAVALVSPVDAVAEALFAVHMTQHLLLMVVAAPLLVLGAPQVGLAWGLPRRLRVPVGRRGHAVWHALAHPGPAFALHTAAVWLWHVPGAYDAAVRHTAVHALEHFSFLVTALLFWWTFLHPSGRLRRSPGVALLYVFGMTLVSGALGALITFSGAPWYRSHLPYTAAWGLTPMEDQQLAGLIMWVPGGLAYLAGAAWIFLDWMRASEARTPASPEAVPVTVR